MAIGFPTITQYGSSYGKFGGIRLSNYTNPSPDTTKLNNSDQKGVVEFKSFEQTIKDFIFAKLGYPTVRVELTDFQIQICIEEAMSKLDYHAPQWMNQYAVFSASANINIYELPLAIANNLTDAYSQSQLMGMNVPQGSLEYDLALMFFGNVGTFSNYNVGQYVLMQQYLKQVKAVMGQKSTWTLTNGKYLNIFPIPYGGEGIILEFRGIDSETILPAYKNWIQRFATCLSKEILGRVRSKYQVLPGPGGGSKLDGELLLREAAEEKVLLIEELTTEIENPPLFSLA